MSTATTERLYALVRTTLRHDCDTPKSALPTNGIYLFFEEGERLEIDGVFHDRIVRVGTHRADGRFPKRIRQHYGNLHPLGGNKNGSVFRKHLGGALLRKNDPVDPRLSEWLRQGGDSFPEVEEEVSRTLRRSFTFTCFPVPTQEERLELEAALIGQLAWHPLGGPSPQWLGHWAADRRIGRAGLWNNQHIDAMPLNEAQLDLIAKLVTG